MKLDFCTRLSVSGTVVIKNFNQELLSSLRPPWVGMKILRFDGCNKNDQVHIQLKQYGAQEWVSVISEEGASDKEWYFIDEGIVLPWPLSRWKHLHKVVFLEDNCSLILDQIEFTCRPGILAPIVWPFIWATFVIRPRLYRKFFEGLTS